MKKWLVLGIGIQLVLSCISDSKTDSYYSETLEVEGFPEIKAHMTFLQGNTTISEHINKTIIDSTLNSMYLEKPETSIDDALHQFADNFKSFKNDFPESPQQWALVVDTEIVFQSQNVLSYSINSYSYTGGAHGNDRIILLNFNPSTGQILQLNDIISDIPSFTTIAEAAFIKSQKNADENFKIEDYFYGDGFVLPENIGFNEDGLILLYNVYEVASYAQGYTEFAIPYEDLTTVLKVSPY